MSSISNDRTNYVGDLTEPDLIHILEVCRVSKLFKESEKKGIFKLIIKTLVYILNQSQKNFFWLFLIFIVWMSRYCRYFFINL